MTHSPWRPYDTMPKDGKKFLALTADFERGIRFNERVQEAWWTGKTPDDFYGHFRSANGQLIVCWMPRPDLPKQSDAECVVKEGS